MSKRRRKDFDYADGDEGPDIWQRLSRLLLVLVFLFVLAGILTLFWPEIERQQRIDADLKALTELRDETLKQRNLLSARLEWMRTDPEYLEAIARDRLDLRKPGEYIIRIEDMRSAAEAASAVEGSGVVPEVRRPTVLK